MKYGRQCRDCLVTIHKKCEEKYNNDIICPHEPINVKTIPVSLSSEDDLKNIVHIEMPDSTPSLPATIDDIESNSMKNNDALLVIPNNNRTTANRLSTKAAAAFSVLDSTARRSFRAFGNKNIHQPITTMTTTNLIQSLSSTSELSKSDESLNNALMIPTKKPTITNSPAQTSSKLANAASSAYSRLREFKSKRLPATPEINPIRKIRLPSDSSKILSDLF
jgi:hypothetical protein